MSSLAQRIADRKFDEASVNEEYPVYLICAGDYKQARDCARKLGAARYRCVELSDHLRGLPRGLTLHLYGNYMLRKAWLEIRDEAKIRQMKIVQVE